MAIVESDLAAIDITKLKKEIEAANTNQVGVTFKVVKITPKTATELAKIEVLLSTGADLSEAQVTTIEAVVAAHTSTQRKRVLAEDLPLGSIDASNKAYVDQKIADLINSAPEYLDTLKELSDALNDDPNFADTVAGQLATINTRLDNLDSGVANAVTGSGTANYLSKWSASKQITDSIIFDSGSQIGIGTSSPTSLLDVAADIKVNGITIGRGAGNLSFNSTFGENALAFNTTGNSNSAFGNYALWKNDTANYNSAFGFSALTFNTTGEYNVAVGASALFRNTSGTYQTAIGYQAMYAHTTGNALGPNVAVGAFSLYTLTTGYRNVAVGPNSMIATTSGYENVAVGFNTLTSNTTAHSCVAIGAFALDKNTTANWNTAVGKNALSSTTTGGGNTAVGFDTLPANTTGFGNCAFGSTALRRNTTGYHNSAFGSNALGNNTTGNSNIAIGQNTHQFNTTGYRNTSVGNSALQRSQTGRYNVAIGDFALSYLGGESWENFFSENNTAVGYAALYSNKSGNENTALGYEALYLNTAAQNTAIGTQALRNNTTGTLNSSLGYRALYSNTTGYSNTAIGTNSMTDLTTGNDNTALGAWALRYSTTGQWNTAIGAFAMRNGTTATANTAVGQGSMFSITTAVNNVGVGGASLNSVTTGSYNVVVGNDSLRDLTIGASNIVIGNNSGRGIVTGSKNTIIGANITGLSSTLSNNILIADGDGVVRFKSDDAGTISLSNSMQVTSAGSISGASWNGTEISIAKGGTGATTAQAAINSLTQVSSATNEHVLTKDSTTGNATWKPVTADSIGLAAVATSGSYTDLINKPTLFSGDYNDLTNKPTLFSGAYADLTGKPSLATVATSGSYNDLLNKPSLATVATSGSYTDLTNKPTIPTTLAALTGDVTITTPSVNQVLSYDGSKWVNSNPTSGTLSSLNTLTASNQTFAIGTSGTDFNILSSGSTHTFNIPNASATARGLISTSTQTIAGQKSFTDIVGIGTTSPGYPLTVQCGSGVAVGIESRGRSSDNVGVILLTQNNGPEVARIQSAPSYLAINKIGNNPIAFSTNGAERLIITGDGNVGIGTTSPSEKLHVNGAIQIGGAPLTAWDTGFRLWGEAGWGARYDGFQHRFDVGSSRTEAMRITSGGNVGIGSTTPNSKLTVIGNITATSDITSSGGAIVSSLSTNEGGRIVINNGSKGAGNFNNWYIYNMTGGYGNGLSFWGYGNSSSLGNVLFLGDNGNVGIGTSSPGHKLDVTDTIRTAGNVIINNASPTLYLQDTDNRSAMFHCNSNFLYVLRGSGNNSLGWTTYNGSWPLVINLENNDASFGGAVSAVGNITSSGTIGTSGNLEIAGRATIGAGGFFGDYLTVGNNGDALRVRWATSDWGTPHLMSGYINAVVAPSGAYIGVVDGFATIGKINASSLRYKYQIEDVESIYSEKIYNIKPRWYRWKNDRNSTHSYWGFIAEEVAEIDPRLVGWEYLPEDLEDVQVTDELGNTVTEKQPKEGAEQVPSSVFYDRFVVFLVDVAQKQNEKIKSLEERLQKLEALLLKDGE